MSGIEMIAGLVECWPGPAVKAVLIIEMGLEVAADAKATHA